MKKQIQELLIQRLGQLKAENLLSSDITLAVQVENARDESHGDFASNVALILAKQAKKNPRELAQQIIDGLPNIEWLEKVEIAGPGFINFYLEKTAQLNVVSEVLNRQQTFGHCSIGNNKKVHLEFVSANPTGPLHVGHGRGAAFGATLANILEIAGYKVHREYYVNDAGRQMNILAASIWLRYLKLCGEGFAFPSNGYKGDYVITIAEKLKTQVNDQLHHSAEEVFANVPADETKTGRGDKEAHIDGVIKNARQLLGDDYKVVFNLGLKEILTDIKDDLHEFGVDFQEWFSEQQLMNQGAVEHGLDRLAEKGFVYEKDGAKWFRSTEFGDEKDRVLVREDGRTTYFASDVAYHVNKIERGYDMVIDVLGADHHGYVPRVRAAMSALGVDDQHFYVPLVQFAVLYRGSEKVPMSTRSGSFVTLRQLREEVGVDAARFFYVMRKVQQHMDFDLDLATSKSNENPVYYIQYAHARVCSVMRQLAEKDQRYDQVQGLQHLSVLSSDYETTIVSLLSRYPEVIKKAATSFEPHVLIIYLRELANAFHTYYNAEQFLVNDEQLRNARLCLINAVKQVVFNGLGILNVSSPEKM